MRETGSFITMTLKIISYLINNPFDPYVKAMSLRTLDPLSKCGGVSAWEWVLSVVTTQWCNTDMSPWQCHFCRFTKSSELLPQRHSPPTVSMEVQRMNHRRAPCNQVLTFWWVLQAGSWITWPEAVLTYQNWGQLVELLYSRDVSEGNYVWNFIAFIAQISIFMAYTNIHSDVTKTHKC